MSTKSNENNDFQYGMVFVWQFVNIWVIFLFQDHMRDVVLWGLELWMILVFVPVIAGIVFYIVVPALRERKKRKADEAKIELIPNHCGMTSNGTATIGITAKYVSGTIPVLLESPIFIFEKAGRADFGFFTSSHLKPDHKQDNYTISANPFPGDRVMGVSMKDVGGKRYYSTGFPREHKYGWFKMTIWKIKHPKSLFKKIKLY